MYKIESLVKKFGIETALNQINLVIEMGSIHGLIGKNGAGKSTLLKTMMGIYKPDAGHVTYQDAPIHEDNAIKCQMYFIPEVAHYNTFDTLDSVASLHRAHYPLWSDDRYHTLISGFGFDGHKRIDRLSKGEQRLLHFCFALASKPQLLLLDEPFDGLDPVVRHQVKNLLIQDVAERQMTIFISSHQLDTLENFCDHMTLIHNGTVRMSGDIDTLKSQTHKLLLAFDTAKPFDANGLDVLYQESTGNLHTLVVRGDYSAVSSYVQSHSPKLFETLPLNLEELFIYEMEGLNHAHKNITI